MAIEKASCIFIALLQLITWCLRYEEATARVNTDRESGLEAQMPLPDQESVAVRLDGFRPSNDVLAREKEHLRSGDYTRSAETALGVLVDLRALLTDCLCTFGE